MANVFSPYKCSLLYLLWTMLICPLISQSHLCDHGWFGSNCQYKCRCGEGTCDQSGVCSDGVCERGWFGPGCQFVDLAYTKRTQTTPGWLNDGNAAMCNQDQSLKQLPVKLSSEFPFTWLRLQVNDPSLLHEFQVTFIDRRNQTTVPCKNMRKVTVSKLTLDIHCDLDVAVQGVVLEGDGTKSLCSLYISGGRNVALRQNASQSSTYSNVKVGHTLDYAVAENAVDGNIDSEWANTSCASTNVGDRNPSWTLTMWPAHVITRYTVYNGNNNQERIMGFTLTSFTNDGKMVFNYTDRKTAALQVYTVTHVPVSTPVSVVTIRVNATLTDPILHVCEVEMYGDSACPPGKYGPECEHTCNCAVKDESCFVSTGGCPSGCAAGFQGEGCDRVCDLGKYGLDCSSNCSQFCVATNSSRSPCLLTDGACVFGCVSGYQAPKCEPILLPVKGHRNIQVDDVAIPMIAAVIIVVLVVLGIFLWKRCRAISRNRFSTVESEDGNNDSLRYEQVEQTELTTTTT